MVVLGLLVACDGPKPSDDTDPAGADSVDSVAPDSPTDSPTETDSPTPMTDADGDGFVAIETGGDDCDDQQATVYPGAPEACDAVDQDCDGEALANGVCGEIQDGRVVARILGDVPVEVRGHDVLPLGDLDGDGLPEVFLGCLYGCTDEGGGSGWSVLRGGTLNQRVPEDSLLVIAANVYGGSDAIAPGDLNGDGYEDLVADVHEYVRGLFVYYGPFALKGERLGLEDADVVYSSDLSGSGSGWGHPSYGGFDINGDGRTDMTASPAGNTTENIAFDIFLGGSPEGAYVRITDGYGGLPLGDLDGDGITDLQVAEATAAYGWASGIDVAAADGAPASDLMAGWWLSNTDLDKDGLYDESVLSDWKNVGDLDGDGVVELAAPAPNQAGTGSGYEPDYDLDILIFSAPFTGQHDAGDAVGSFGLISDAAVHLDGADRIAVADFDCDGIQDIATHFADSDIPATYDVIYPGYRGIPPLGTQVDDTFYRVTDDVIMSAGDLDQDGCDDLLGFFEGDDSQVVYGFPVPWNEPQWW